MSAQEAKAPVPPAAPAVADVNTGAEDQRVFDLKKEASDLGKPDTLRYKILTAVLNEKYEIALKELEVLLEQPSEYPDFKERVSRFVKHALDLIFAIRAKRNFGGLASLTRSKQQELKEKFIEHFRELQYVLKKIEKIERDIKINDVKSTIYVVKAIWVAALAILGVAFVLEIARGLAQSGVIVLDDYLTKFANWLFQLIGM